MDIAIIKLTHEDRAINLMYEVLHTPYIWSALSDRQREPAYFVKMAEMLKSGSYHYYVPMVDDHTLGLVWGWLTKDRDFVPHISFLRPYWGLLAKRAALATEDYITATLNPVRFVAFIPTTNRASHRFALRCGFTTVGTTMDVPFTVDGTPIPCWDMRKEVA
jgi:RimJ/RimL family protein N-acetyltransferase